MADNEFKGLIKIRIPDPYAQEVKPAEPPTPVVQGREVAPAAQEREGNPLGEYLQRLNQRLRDAGVPPTPLGDGTMSGYVGDVQRQIRELDEKERQRGR